MVSIASYGTLGGEMKFVDAKNGAIELWLAAALLGAAATLLEKCSCLDICITWGTRLVTIVEIIFYAECLSHCETER